MSYLVLFTLSSIAYGPAQASAIYEKYLQETGIPEDCAAVTPRLVTAVVNEHFKTNLTIIIFDEFYNADFKFKWILDEVLQGIKYSTVKFGNIKSIFEGKSENEQPSWVIFSNQMEGMDGKTLLITHNSPFLIKEWLITNLATKYMDIIAVSDPALQKFQGRENDCDTSLYTHFFTGNVPRSTASIVTSWRKTNFTRATDLFPNKFQNGFKGIHLIIEIESQPPFTFKRTDYNRETTWDGLEVRLIHHLSEVLNFTYEFKEFNTKLNRYNKGALNDVKEEHIGLGMGRQITSVLSKKALSFSFPHSVDCAAFISLTSTALPKYRAIMGPFLWDVWLAVTATYLLAIFPITFSAWHTIRPLLNHPAELENMFWYVFGTFTNCFTFHGENSWTKGAKCSTKLFIGTYWVFTIIITACYTGSIIAFITLPQYPEVVDTMQQLLHKNYRITTLDKEGWWELLTAGDDDEASGLAGTAETVSDVFEGIRTIVDSIHEDKPVAFLGSAELLTYILKTNYTSSDVGKRKLFHISKQCFIKQFVSLVLPPESLYMQTLNNALLRVMENGLLLKFTKDLEWMMYKSSERTLLQGGLKIDAIERQLTLDDTQGMFLLLGSGFSIGLCAFAFEIGNWMKNREGDPLTSIAKEKLLNLSRRVSQAHQHYPLYFKSDYWHGSSLFGSLIDTRKPVPAISDINLKPPPAEKPIRLLSF